MFVATLLMAKCFVPLADTSGQTSQAGQSGAQSKTKPSRGSETQPASSATSDPAAALQFLGSYSAPSAILSTETGHTSARPPSASAERRLREIDGNERQVFEDAASERQWLLDELATSAHTPAEWFEIGGAALDEARASSKRLAETDPDGVWNRRLEAEALEARYPLLARQVLPRNRSGGPLGKPGAGARRPEHGPGTPGERAGGEAPGAATLAQAERLADSPEAFYRRARAALQVSQAAYRRASTEPEFEARLFALEALAAEEEDDEAAALEKYQAGLAKYPRSAALHAGLGQLYRRQHEFDRARAELQEAARLDPSDAVVAFELGDIDERQGKPQQALDLLNRALALDPGLLVARWCRAKAYVALKDDNRALADLEAAAPADDTGELQWQLARLYQKLGRPALAAQAEKRSEEQRRTTGSRQ
ncbi:MAG TPA: tetratricopeptide repeat protein [Terriglobia bacterium]|nr:tetratricopeptide repeat protein [Terriglobia bacterium]